MKKLIQLLIVFFCFFAIELHAEIFSWVDENGVRHYSNTAPENEDSYEKKEEIQSPGESAEPSGNTEETHENDPNVDEWLKQKEQEKQKYKEEQLRKERCENAKAWLEHVKKKPFKDYLAAVRNNPDYGQPANKATRVKRNINNRDKANEWQMKELEWAKAKVECECNSGACNLKEPLHKFIPELKN